MLGEIKDSNDFKSKLDAANKDLVVVHFWAPWADQCKQMNDVMEELSKKFTKVHFYKLEAEEIAEISMQFEIEAVPTFIFFKKSKKISRLDGAHAPQLEDMVKKNIDAIPPPMSDEEDKKTALNQRLKSLLNSANCLLFMKGTPTQPRCGFSRQIIEILNKHECEFSTFDILEDDDIRQGLKAYSNWPTYPQLYIDGELLGGLDITKEMDEDGELKNTLPKKVNLDQKLKSLINKQRVMLFMKGSPDMPKCGFSMQTIEILNNTKVDFGHFDILTDNEVRQGLKSYSNWPTYPQLYVNGELIGGLDIIKEMVEENELVDTLKAQ